MPNAVSWVEMDLGNSPEAQLYDLSTDPAEKQNVAIQYPEVVKRLSVLLNEVKSRKKLIVLLFPFSFLQIRLSFLDLNRF